ncbi:MAG: DUF2321 domain-containing protein, partial [Fimbriimonadaceae bacterium]|nr:DUF2321 domain-containing protein [Fimbriimonadaceae bacterium]
MMSRTECTKAGMEFQHDTAQVCLNGHTVSSSAGSQPGRRQAHCIKCGEPTLMECPACKARILG